MDQKYQDSMTSPANDEYGMTNEGIITPDQKGKGKAPPTDAPIVVEPIKQDDLQPSYAYQMEVDNHSWYGSMINSLGNCMGALGAIPFCFCCPNPFKSVDQGQVGLVTRFGQFYKSVDPGLVRVNPLSEKIHSVEVRIQVLDIPHQTCMTKDNVNIRLSSVMYYHVTSPHKARFGINNVYQALQERTQTTLRHVVGARALQEIIERREEVAQSIEEIINDTANSWGVRVESILIKDILLSDDLQDSLAQAAKARRTGESKVIVAKAEVESAKQLRRAADILASKPAMQIRYLEAMQQMAKSSNSKVIFMPSQSALENFATDVNHTDFQAAVDTAEPQRQQESSSNRLMQNAAYQEM